GALRTFAENALSSPLRKDESPVLTPLIRDFLQAQGQGGGAAERKALIGGFTALEKAAGSLHDEFPNDGFVAEMNPWLDKARHLGVAGRLATAMLIAQQEGDADAAKRLRTELDRHLTRDLTDVTVPVTRRTTRTLDGVNVARGTAELVMYTPEFGPTTKTNQWGYEVTVVADKVVSVGGNNSPIPKGGYVLSVHSAGDGDWLRHGALVGSTVAVADGTVTITTKAGTYLVPNLATYARGVVQPYVDRAIRENDNWLGGRDEAGPYSTLPAYGEYALERMTDGDLDTFYWTAGGPKAGDYVGVDLGETRTVTSIEVHMASTSGPAPRPSDYLRHGVLQVSTDGSRWTNVGEFRDQPDITVTLDSPLQARFVRLQALTTQAGWVQVREFTTR
ncbi:MAG: discoidin domain-containing protein, partial [Micromonosporaceae bacterium]